MKNRNTYSFSKKVIREMLKNGILSEFELNQVYLDVVERVKKRQIIYNVCRIIVYIILVPCVLYFGIFSIVDYLSWAREMENEFLRVRWTYLSFAPLAITLILCLVPLVLMELWEVLKVRKFLYLARKGYPSLKEEDVVSRLKLSKPLESCEKCGGDQFDQMKEKQKCKFCDTLYLTPSEKDISKLAKAVEVKKVKVRYAHLILIGVGLLLYGAIRVPYTYAYQERHLTSEVPARFWRDSITYHEVAYLHKIPGWSEELFREIRRSQWFNLGNTRYYYGGTAIQELIDIVGSPSQISNYISSSGQTFSVVRWNSLDSSRWSPFVSVVIHMTPENNVMFSVIRVEEGLNWEDTQFAKNHIHYICGWSLEIFREIEVATRHIYYDTSVISEEYVGGSSFLELLLLLEDSQVSNERSFNGIATVTWLALVDESSVYVRLEVEEETDRIIGRWIGVKR